MSKIEYEVRVLEINKEEIQSKLKQLNAVLIEDVFQKRYVYDFKPAIPSKWIRLRTNGTKSTLTIKNIESSNIDGTKETEIYIEIEGTSEEKVYNTLKLLGIPKEKATTLDVQTIYKEIYSIDIYKEPNLSFEDK